MDIKAILRDYYFEERSLDKSYFVLHIYMGLLRSGTSKSDARMHAELVLSFDAASPYWETSLPAPVLICCSYVPKM